MSVQFTVSCMFFTLFVNFFVYIFKFLHVLWMKIQMRDNKNSSFYVFKLYHYEKIKIAKGRKTPLPRSGHRIVCDSTNLYSFGGYNPLIIHDDELWKFNFAIKQWKCYKGRQNLPQELASNAVVRTGKFLMVYGGTGSPFGVRSSNQLYVCALNDENGHIVEIDSTGQHPLPQYGQALVYHNNYLYTIGGTTGFTYSCDIHRINMINKVWENVYICSGQGDYEPTGRYRHEVAFDGTRIYILGGGTADDAFGFEEIPTFNIDTKKWHKVATKSDPRTFGFGKPCPRRCHGAVQIEIENDIHVFINGGYDGETVFNDLWRLELSTMQWTYIENCILPKPMYFHSSAICPEGKMYIFGGIYGGDTLTRSNTIYSIWLCIPKLSEMCWEAILHYNPQIVNYTKEQLAHRGLPRNFLSRLDF